jgi:hypothetical protein
MRTGRFFFFLASIGDMISSAMDVVEEPAEENAESRMPA